MIGSSVLVTGSNRGIGLELIHKFLCRSQPPQKIFATCRNPEGPRSEELRTLASKHSNIVLLPLDATDIESVKKAAVEVEKYLNGSGLNLLINNAGVISSKKLEKVDADEMIDTFKTNVVGPLQVSQAALNMLTRLQAESYKKDGILCTALHPGWVKTELGTERAPLTTHESATGIMEVLGSLSEKQNGLLVSWEGNVIPW
ncbi:C-signal-like isoform X2 [Dendrobates tinctorius]|uniref:C-signal-like isoform X2 n=1 Tax=Dendrobates tinctorius TaxID=92724 RepID=UPI003CCA368E